MRHRRRAFDGPLLNWSETQQPAKARRARLVRWLAITGAGVVLALLPAALPPKPRLVWNASASAPIGLYWVDSDVWAEPGDTVVARLPARFREFAARRRYLPSGVPLVKHVAAYGGDLVCARGQQILINGHRAATRKTADGKGRPMPSWSGCVRLHGRQIFLLNDKPASFDGRYFGPTEGTDIIGKAHLLWRR